MEAHLTYHLVIVPIAYLLGSVPFGLLVARAMGGADPRSVGSGNIGATNVRRSAGKGAGVITLVLDFFKGFVPVYVAWHLGAGPFALSAVAFGAVIGHLRHLQPGPGVPSAWIVEPRIPEDFVAAAQTPSEPDPEEPDMSGEP